MTEESDASTPETRYPDFLVGLGFFSWRCDHLSTLVSAIAKWKDDSHTELDGNYAAQKAEHTDEASQEYLSDWHGEEEGRVKETARVMYAGLAVAVASHIESTFEFFCKQCGVTLPERANWGHKRESLEKTLGCLSSLDGHEAAQRARLLANCFKHNNGAVDDKYSDVFGGVLGVDIPYETLAWDEIVDGTDRFLHGVFKLARHYWN